MEIMAFSYFSTVTLNSAHEFLDTVIIPNKTYISEKISTLITTIIVVLLTVFIVVANLSSFQTLTPKINDLGDEEKIQCVKCLPCKHEDLSSNQMSPHVCNPIVHMGKGGGNKRIPRSSRAS